MFLYGDGANQVNAEKSIEPWLGGMVFHERPGKL